MMMCLGTVYSWSLVARPLVAAFHWSVTTTMWTFAVAIFTLGIGAVVGGRWQDRVGPRNVAITGIVLWALGNVLAGLFTARFGVWWLYVSYGVIGGFGLGMGYVSPVAMVTKWFPRHRGLAGGLVLTGFGLGAFFYNGIVPHFAGFARAAADATLYLAHGTPMARADVAAVMSVFVWSGLDLSRRRRRVRADPSRSAEALRPPRRGPRRRTRRGTTARRRRCGRRSSTCCG